MMRFRGLLAGAVLVFAAAAMWAGCGVKSPPIPPEYAKPERIMNLTVDSEKRGIELTWGRPDRYAGGDTLRDLAKFVVARSDAGAPYQQIKDVPVTDQDRFQKQRVFQYLDRNTVVGHSYSYRVISETSDGYESDPSNEATLTRTVPPPPPNPETYVLPTPKPLP
jgi:hypothetical protein